MLGGSVSNRKVRVLTADPRDTAGMTARSLPAEVIEVVDADPSAFGPMRAPRPPHQPWTTHQRHIAALIAVAVVAAMIGAGVLIAHPWRHPPTWTRYPAPAVDPSGTDLLVLGQAPAPLVSAIRALDASGAAADPGELFASPGAHTNVGRWILFRVDRSQAGGSDLASSAVLDTAPNGASRLEWADELGRWTVTSFGLEEARVRAFAAALSWHDDAPTLDRSFPLGDLTPIGSVAGFDAASRLASGLGQAALPNGVTVAYYRSVRYPTAIASTPAPDDAAGLMTFVLPGTPTDVRGHPGVLANSVTLGRVLTWVEDGRLVLVAGPQDPDSLHRLATSIEPTTDATAWRAGVNGASITSSTTTAVPIGFGTTPDGRNWTVSGRFGTVTVVCATVDAEPGAPPPESACVADQHATLPHMMFIETSVGTIVVALSNAPTGAILKLHDVEDHLTFLPLRPLVWNISAYTFLPNKGDGYSLIEGSG